MTAALYRLFGLSLQGSVLAAVILLVKRLAGDRLTAGFHYGIWCVLLLRLMIPFSISYARPLAVWSTDEPPVTAAFMKAGAAVRRAAETAGEGLARFREPQEDGLPDGTPPPQASVESAGENPPPAGAVPSAPESPRTFRDTVRALLPWGYLAGVLLYAAAMLAGLLHHRRARLPQAPPAALAAWFAEERERFRAPRRTRLCLAVSGTPYAAGVLFPKVVLPLVSKERLSESGLRAVFRHELTHIRYGDPLLRALLVILQGVYWFNPALWYAFACIRRDCEYACDARVLRRSAPAERLSYGQALLAAAEACAPSPVTLYNAFAVSPLRRRIERIVAYRPARRGAWLAAAALSLLCLTAGAAVGAQRVEVLTLDAADLLTDERLWSWSPEYPLLAGLPEEDLTLYAVDAGLLDEGKYSDWTYSGRLALRQGDEVQLCGWTQTYASGWPAITAGDFDGDGRREYLFEDYANASFSGERDGCLRMVRRDALGCWDGSVTLDGYEVRDAVAAQFAAGNLDGGALTFTLNGEPCRIALPADLRERPLGRLDVLPYVRFHTEDPEALSVSIAVGAYFDDWPTFAGYLTAPVVCTGDALTVGTAAFSGSLFRDYPPDWLRLYDEESGLTLGLPAHWDGQFLNFGPRSESESQTACMFELYEAYNYAIPPKYGDGIHFGFLLNFHQPAEVFEDWYLFLGYRNGQPVEYCYPHGVEYDDRDPEAHARYQPLNMDEYEIVSRFVVANHVSVKQRLDYWDLMQ